MNDELVKTLQRVIDARMVECRTAREELCELATDAIDDDDEDESSAVEDKGIVLRDAIDLMDALRKLLGGRTVREIHAAFGAPGHWGYDNPIGKALSALYHGAPKEPAPVDAVAQATTAERERCATVAEWTADTAMKMADDARREGRDLEARSIDYAAKVATQIAKAVRAERAGDTEPFVPPFEAAR